MTEQQRPASYTPEIPTVGRRSIVGPLETALQGWEKRSSTTQWCPDTLRLECTSQATAVHPTCSMRKHQQVSSGLREPPVRTAGITSIWEQTSRKPMAGPCWKIGLYPTWSISFPLMYPYLQEHFFLPTSCNGGVQAGPRSQRGERKTSRNGQKPWNWCFKLDSG